GTIRIAHAHVDDVLAAPSRSHLELAGDVEDVGRQAADARKFPRRLHGMDSCRRFAGWFGYSLAAAVRAASGSGARDWYAAAHHIGIVAVSISWRSPETSNETPC